MLLYFFSHTLPSVLNGNVLSKGSYMFTIIIEKSVPDSFFYEIIFDVAPICCTLIGKQIIIAAKTETKNKPFFILNIIQI